MIAIKSQHALLVFAVVLLLSGLYALTAYALLRPENAGIAFVRKEIQGINDEHQATTLYYRLAQSRRPAETAAEILKVAQDRRGSSWQTARQRISAFTAPPGFAEVKQTVRSLIRDIGDESNLILDPELPSYYAADLLLNGAPLLAEHLLADDIATGADLLYHLDQVRHTTLAICRVPANDCPRLLAQIAALDQNLSRPRSSPLTPEEATEGIRQIKDISGVSESILRAFLNERLESQTRLRQMMVLAMVGLYVFLVFLILFSLRNYASRREIILARETRELAAKLARKNDELEKFAYAAAHDLKEPVRTMRCYATLVTREAPRELSESAAQYLAIIEGAAKRAEQMINDLLGYCQVSESKLAIASCDCNTEVRAVLEDLKLLIDGVKPVISMAEFPVIFTVPSMFRRLMSNLIDNAIKYRKPDAPLNLRLGVERQADNWVFAVQDDGIGIAPEASEIVFEPFRRLNPSLHQEGQGIGLTSCRKIVERLGGNIWLSANDSGGTTVFFSLPAAAKKKA